MIRQGEKGADSTIYVYVYTYTHMRKENPNASAYLKDNFSEAYFKT